jgi:hypothetical protein
VCVYVCMHACMNEYSYDLVAFVVLLKRYVFDLGRNYVEIHRGVPWEVPCEVPCGVPCGVPCECSLYSPPSASSLIHMLGSTSLIRIAALATRCAQGGARGRPYEAHLLPSCAHVLALQLQASPIGLPPSWGGSPPKVLGHLPAPPLAASVDPPSWSRINRAPSVWTLRNQ